MLCRSHDDQQADSFLKQRILMALKISHSACVLGTVSDRDAFAEICFIEKNIQFFQNLYIIAAFKKTFLPVDWDSGWYE